MLSGLLQLVYRGFASRQREISPPPKLGRNEYILEHSEAFEDWLKGECERSGQHFPRVYGWLQANSFRLERELHWINEGKLP